MFSSLFIVSVLTALNSVAAIGPAAVNLRTAGNFAILAKSGVSTVPPSVITGSVGISPISATGLTGFSLTVDPSGQFSTSVQVVGKLLASSYTAPTPSTLTTAIGDMGTAFNDASGRVNPNFNNLGAGLLGGLTLTPGLYKWTTAVNIATDVIIAGSPLDTWIFQVSGSMTIASGKRMILIGGALPKNIVWVVAGGVTAAAGSHIEGVVLGKTLITLQTGATANSRLLAQTFVALQKIIWKFAQLFKLKRRSRKTDLKAL
ncbi:antifreeze protein [Mycena belliarum]|uniref:Antifreeze protein n=1 Tax=Mycena belliarum TaxID=1033014 RepID=A0AAD6UIJ1_9AGAR|nr:antifreeze protein [Mycena belliae]